MTHARYCVIGAGAAGLATVAVLRAQGFSVDCFERTDRVAGHWHTDYESLHLITSRDVSGFAGFPMPAGYPVYPSRDQMREYQESFARHHGLYDVIRFGTEVTAVEPIGGRGAGGWTVTTDDGRQTAYDGVLVANGHLWQPHLPAYPGTFTGLSLHSSRYRSAGDVDGSRVLVVGAGNSGCDLAVDAAMACKETAISVRRGQVFLPKAFFGRPRAELRWLSRLPAVAQERITRALVDVVVGPPTAYAGLPEPVTRNLNKQPPVVNNLLLYWIHHGRVAVVPGVDRLDGRRVHFTDGTAREFDTILWATGFEVGLPFLDPGLLRWERGAPLRVGGLTVPVGLERLYFIGLASPRGPQLPVYSAQAELVARMLRLTERSGAGVGEQLAQAQPPDHRIDIVRADWNAQLRRTGKLLDRLDRRRPVVTPTTAPAPVGSAG
jgi:hypothetical protein